MFYIVGTWFISSIPIARSIQKRRWFVQNQRLSLYSGPTFGLTSDFESQKALAKSKKKRAGRLLSSSFPARFFLDPRYGKRGKLRFCDENRRSFYSTLII